MQRIGHGLTDFFINWLRTEKNLSRVGAEGSLTNLASELLKSMTERKRALFDTPSMVAAIYLDPRVKIKLNNTQKECAVLFIKKLYIRMHQLKETDAETTNVENNTLDELNEEFAAAEGDGDEVDTINLMVSLANYDLVRRVDVKCAVMDFWKNRKEEFPLIYPLACVIHSIPAGQCLEERNFSSFGFIRN